jgi:hypothetical protein
VDSVPGGSASAYDYCNADPVNCTDLGGTWGFLGNIVETVAKVAEVASMIPGPIGAAAAGVSSVAYAATGNTAKAVEMGITAAAQLVGAGAAVAVGFRVAKGIATAAKIGNGAARAAPKLSRVASAAQRANAGAAIVRKGQAGERAWMRASSMSKNTNIVKVNGRKRIPDGLSRHNVHEVKNVMRQSYTRQLRDAVDIARGRGGVVHLWVNTSTRLSKNVLNNPAVKVHRLVM